MRVEALIHRSPVTISSSATIKQAAEVFVREGIGLLVIAASVSPVRAEAVLSERDVVRAVAGGVAAAPALRARCTEEIVGRKGAGPPSRGGLPRPQKPIMDPTVQNDHAPALRGP